MCTSVKTMPWSAIFPEPIMLTNILTVSYNLHDVPTKGFDFTKASLHLQQVLTATVIYVETSPR